MMRKIKTAIRRLVGIKSQTQSYSQAGEDAIAWKIAKYMVGIEKGFFIDIGAYHPFKHSNTYLLHRAGWRGINIDPAPGTKELFDRHRPKDINIETGIGEVNAELTYYIVAEGSTMNSFSEENLRRLNLFESVRATKSIAVLRLDDLLMKYPEVVQIDYINIDAEGYELEILRSFDIGKRSPTILSIEQNGVTTLRSVLDSEVCDFLASSGYSPVAKNVLLKDVATVFYLRDEFI